MTSYYEGAVSQAAAPPSRLTEYDRGVMDKAREITAVPAGLPALCEFTGEGDSDAAAYVAFYRAQTQVDALLRLVERLGGGDA